MNKINFFTPVFNPASKPLSCDHVRSIFDGYFSKSNQWAQITPKETQGKSQGVILINCNRNMITTIIKVVSYFTLFIPCIMFIGKLAFRSGRSFYIINPSTPSSSFITYKFFLWLSNVQQGLPFATLKPISPTPQHNQYEIDLKKEIEIRDSNSENQFIKELHNLLRSTTVYHEIESENPLTFQRLKPLIDKDIAVGGIGNLMSLRCTPK